jgi:hypothetical protein
VSTLLADHGIFVASEITHSASLAARRHQERQPDLHGLGGCWGDHRELLERGRRTARISSSSIRAASATPRLNCCPKTPSHVGVCLIGGERPLILSAQGDRFVVGKVWLIQRLGAAMRSGEMTGAPGRDLLRKELAQFVFKPGARGRLRLEAARGHDDLVIAAALAVLASDLANNRRET